ncbi:esterase [Mycobacterium sp. MS1601]|uniref:flavin-containing monooxygenase n=1 Tax=Mycobacterium sp. MS1601 TaxID=1936029 RepID=UPI0009793876|nr:alpha/beta hydrolase fold domain-containing protein [Mycobacterium sp. MS1601]AQA04144.1 esterase [Mycobacterium sp. MS1601]
MNNTDVDVVIVGAGFSGLYATHRVRNGLQLSVQAFEAAPSAGGVWHWNTYPGARCDFESIFYSYSFDEDLQREFRWTERFASQPEIKRYLEHVADRFDLRRSYRFNTRVTSVVWDDDAELWRVGTDDGATTTARFFINAAGAFGVTKPNDFPGQGDFGGTVVHTSSWPEEGVELAGKRVAVIGTGSTGIQVIQTIAKEVGELTVFQRTPNFACPLGNRPLSDDEFNATVADYPRIRQEARNSITGAAYPRAALPAAAHTPEQQRAVYDEFYNGGGFRMLASTYYDLITNPEANRTAAEYIRSRIRERVTDPKVAELLCPTDHHYGVKRATFETKYYEAFNEPHVTLVDARATPIVRITEKGIATTDQEYEFDVIILATGFDVGAGALKRMGVLGRGGKQLTDHWAHGQRAYLGAATHGFLNLFHVNGPQSAAALFNNPIAIEVSVDFIAGVIQTMVDRGYRTVEVTDDAETRYNELVCEVADATLFPTGTTWLMGDNIAGKPRTPVSLFTGAPMYCAIVDEVAARDYSGFAFDGHERPCSTLVSLDGSEVFLLAGLMNMGMKPLEQCSLEEARFSLEAFKAMQLPLPCGISITEASYPTEEGHRPVRLYRPEGDGPLPIIVFVHGGGWIGGSLDAFDEPCAVLAQRVGAIVVSPDYRLAPEHPFPAAPHDVLAALRWAGEHASEFGGDPDRMAIGGESAGANLAAVTALRARDEGGPALRAQILVTPPIDPLADNNSRKQFANGPMISAEVGERMWTMYLGDPANAMSPWAAPIRADDLSGLPPTLIVTMEIDPTRDEAEDYAAALQAAGVPTQCRRLARLFHTTLSVSGAVPRAAEIHDAMAEFLGPLLARRTEASIVG